MIQIVGASSLKRVFEFCQSNKVDLRKHITAISGLSLNPHAKSELKNLKFLCTQGYLHHKKLLIWHDIINKSLNAHRSNNFRANTASNLCTTLFVARFARTETSLISTEKEKLFSTEGNCKPSS